LFKNKHEDTE